MFILITGNPKVGKTQLLNLLANDGYKTFNVDNFVNEIYQVNKIGYILIQTHFGKEYTTHQAVNKKKLLALVSNDDYALYRLRILIWPLIKSKLYALKRTNEFMIVEMAIYKLDPLYFNNIFDFIIDINRDNKVNKINHPLSKLYLKPHICFNPNIIINNNSDLLLAYEELVNILEKLK